MSLIIGVKFSLKVGEIKEINSVLGSKSSRKKENELSGAPYNSFSSPLENPEQEADSGVKLINSPLGINTQVHEKGSLDSASLAAFEMILDALVERTGFTYEDVMGMLSKKKRVRISTPYPNKNYGIPIEIFSDRALGVLESVVKYLHDNLALSFNEIAVLLNRDNRTIWGSYSKAYSKMSKPFRILRSRYTLPIEIFSNRALGVLESLVVYLRDSLTLSFHDIAVLLNRDDRTVWTSYRRAKRKFTKRKTKQRGENAAD